MSQEFIINEELAVSINNVVKKFPLDKKRSAVIESLLILQLLGKIIMELKIILQTYIQLINLLFPIYLNFI